MKEVSGVLLENLRQKYSIFFLKFFRLRSDLCLFPMGSNILRRFFNDRHPNNVDGFDAIWQNTFSLPRMGLQKSL